MNNFIKQVIEEKFVSKAQQRYFYAQAGKAGKKGKKWSKWAKEFSNKTDFDKIPDKVKKEEEVDEIVDNLGNIEKGNRPANLSTKGITSNKTSDEVAKDSRPQQGNYGTKISNFVRYPIEEERLTKEQVMEIAMKDALGYQETLGVDADYDEAEQYFEKELELPDEEVKDRMGKMGYDEELPEDKVRLVENPKKFVEEYIESVLSKRRIDHDIVSKESEQTEEKEINPIVLKQLKSLKSSLESNKLTVNDILKHLKDNE
jgi:hypothetical protein